MIKINSFPKTKLTQEEIYLFCLAICQKINEVDAEKLYVKHEYLLLENSVNNMDTSLYKLPKGVYNKRRSILKNDIIAFLKRFFSYIESFPTNNEKNKIDAKNKVEAIISQHKVLGQQTFESLVKNNIKLAEFLSSDILAEAVQILEIEEYIKTLNDFNTESTILIDKKLKNNGLIQRVRKASIVRIELHNNYDKIVKRLNKLVLIYDINLYKPLFEWWNAYTDQLRLDIASRRQSDIQISEDDNIFNSEE